MKKALYFKQSGAVVQWQDDEVFAYAAPSADFDTLPLNDSFVFPDEQRWVAAGKVVSVDPMLPQPARVPSESDVVSLKNSLMAMATAALAPLQDAVDIGDASENEEDQLLAWKQYRVALNRIDQQGGYPADIQWPEAPNA